MGRTACTESQCLYKGALYFYLYLYYPAVFVAQWLRCCGTNRKVAGSIPAGAIGIFY